ncbi:MAG: hypothetical protein Alis3KO_26380 [Aliiglaciecola sp.]
MTGINTGSPKDLNNITFPNDIAKIVIGKLMEELKIVASVLQTFTKHLKQKINFWELGALLLLLVLAWQSPEIIIAFKS